MRRLRKGGSFPFQKDGWNSYTKKSDAEYAAERLQTYLDEQDGPKKPRK